MGLSSPRKRQRRPALVAFRGVVEHDVEDHLDPRPVQGLDHVAELVHRAERVLTRAEGLVRREERDWRVAPVVDLSRRAVLGVELEHRQELHRGDAQLLEVGNLLDQPGERAAALLRHARAGVPREPSHVHLVHDGARGGQPQGCVAFPVVHARVHQHALHRGGRVVAALRGRVTTVGGRHRYAAAVRVEQDLGGVEPHPGTGGARGPVAVQLARLHGRNEDVPVVVRAVARGIEPDHARRPGIVDAIEEQQLDPGRVPREHAEVGAGRSGRRPQGRARASRDAGRRA